MSSALPSLVGTISGGLAKGVQLCNCYALRLLGRYRVDWQKVYSYAIVMLYACWDDIGWTGKKCRALHEQRLPFLVFL